MNITHRNYHSSWRRLLTATFALWTCISALPWASALQGASCPVVEFNGQLQADELTDTPWVTNASMWGIVDHGNASATSATGFLSMNFPGFNPSLFRWEFGNTENLELSTAISPSAVSPGKEIYTNTQGAAVRIEFFYDNVLWATGVVDFIEVNVADVNAAGATGSGGVTLTSSGNTSDFFDEVMALTGGSGGLVFTFNGFEAVNAQGLFQTQGSFTLDPCSPPSLITANAGMDQTALEGSYVQLLGSNEGPDIEDSFDAYQWEQQSGPQIVVDGGGLMTNQAISFYAPNVDQITELTFDLSVTNGGVTSTDSVTVEVYPIEDLGVDCVNFDMGGNLTSESYSPGDSFIHDIHNLDQAQNVPLFEFEVAESRLYGDAFFNNGNAAHAYISPGYENDAVYEAKFLYWQFADITIRPNPEEFDVLPSGITFLVRDEDYDQSEDFVFGVNQEHVVVSGLRDLNGIRLGGTQITVIGGHTLNSVSMVSIAGSPIEELLIGGGSKLKVDHICPAVPAWAQAGLIAEAGVGQDVHTDQVIQLNGTLSTQSNDGSISYQWTQVDGAVQIALSDADSLQPTFIAPEVVDGFMVLTFQLTVNQGNTSDQDTVEIKVFPHAVDVNAGVDQEVEPGELVTVDGSQSSSSSGELNYTWSQLQGPQIIIADNNAESFSFNAPEVNETQVITLQLAATLGGTFATDTVEITVAPAQVVGSDCEFYYLPGINFTAGPPQGGSPDPFSAPAYEGAPEGETWKPDYVKAKYDLDFLGHMMSADFGGGIGEPYPALNYDTITFEPSNGWATVMGDDDRMAGDGAPYAGAEYTSAASNFSGSYADGDARGTVVYSTGDNSVIFELINLGNSAVGGDMSNADTDRGVNMTPGGN
ncbi:hypothetical protein N9079_03000, partial [bacterium]|nr:hypothetical protein [bacterium]